MTRFIGEQIKAEKDGVPPRPVRFTWQGRGYEVAEVLQEWVDTGFGSLPPASRVWYNRRHRRYYIVRTAAGEIFRVYYDYANRKNPTWWLASREDDVTHQ